MDTLETLQERITHLEKHISEQDTEMYHQTRRIEALQLMFKKLELKLESMEAGSGGLPADEKPPHY